MTKYLIFRTTLPPHRWILCAGITDPDPCSYDTWTDAIEAASDAIAEAEERWAATVFGPGPEHTTEAVPHA